MRSSTNENSGSILDNIIMWVPWAMGVVNASLMAYYANNFPSADVDLTRGIISGTSGHVILGTSAASIAVQLWAMIEFLKYHVKKHTGELSVHGSNHRYMQAREWYLGFLLLFYMVAIVSAALDITLVVNYSGESVTIKNKKLNGSFGDAVEGLSYTTIAVAALPLFTYIISEIFTRKWNERKPIISELHADL